MSDKYLTVSEVADLLGMLKENVLRMAQHGALPHPVTINGEPHFPEEPILRRCEEEDDAIPSAGVYLSTGEDFFYYKVVKASHMLFYKNWPFAVFSLWDESLHIRPWLTHLVDDLPDHETILLSCEDANIPEVSLKDLPQPTSIVWGYRSVGQYDLDVTVAASNVSH
ncbi:DNA-binding protein [Mesorhizobium sp. M7A.F.Ca.US.011.01.1.1]|uniref:helix-turn-helix domain-containing protein n=1 Tax=Mesorhizobium sp. M7A.F.Ca.US.011.01.1.1 TaxID=2496741 RepID=UPI000FCB9906|nr:helix-turn-helix domain-containing protein [Mesorhizobium sp. M7A.F.Ca.US.011.01.1.1]RUX27066.1 DNA-binding protein [Mesorhizobium sp. M7A.F.Ca.US.011.01.1.1]